MAEIEANSVLRANLLDDAAVVLAGTRAFGAESELVADAVEEVVVGLGGRVHRCRLSETEDAALGEAADERQIAAALSELGGIELLVLDATGPFTAKDTVAAGGTIAAGLVGTLEASWRFTRAVANAAFIERGTAGRIVYLAPRPDAGAHALAAVAGLENLARTLSIEWARYGIAPVTIAPGRTTSAQALATLVAYLGSPAGDYFSGCLLDLRGPLVGEQDGGAARAAG